MRVLVAAVVLVGCWTAPRPTGPPALLRRHHADGAVLRVCERGDGRVVVAGEAPAWLVLRGVANEHVRVASPRQYELRRDVVTSSGRVTYEGTEHLLLELRAQAGTPFTVDDRNRRPDLVFQARANQANYARLDAVPSILDLVGVTYPERPIRQHESFPLRVRRTLHKEGAMPSDLAIDVTFTVVKVTPTHVELTCAGTQRELVRAGDERAVAELDLGCRVRLDRRDGRTSRWWIDADGRLELPTTKVPTRVTSHYDVAVGDVDPEVCTRAAEP